MNILKGQQHTSHGKRQAIRCFLYLATAIGITSCGSDKPTYLEPRLSTEAASDITRTGATLNGSVNLEGDTDMPQLFFKFGTSQDLPQTTVDISPIANDHTTYHVACPIDQLTAGTTYYYRLQGSNGRVSLTSNTMTFTTQPNDKPTLGDTHLLSHGPMSVIVGYEIQEDGGETIDETGCYYALASESTNMGNEKPSQVQTKAVLPNYSGNIGDQKLLIGDLQRNATYLIWPYAKSNAGEAIGECISFTTTDAITTHEAGDLSVLMGNNLYDFSSITLAGPLDGDDLKCLRMMMGCDADGTKTHGKLAQLDMTDAKIVEGGGPYGSSRYTQDHVIGQGLFADCTHLTEVRLPTDATTLEKDAFSGCTALTQLEIPAFITTLQPSSGCTALQDISVSAANPNYQSQDGVLLNRDATAIVWFPMGKQGSYTLPSTITSISSHAFQQCRIETFQLPDGLTDIGQGAFMDSWVKEVKLPASLRTLPTSTFQGCTRLEVVWLGSKTEQISDYAFDLCPLTDMYVDAAYPPVCSSHAFTTRGTPVTNTCTIHVPLGKSALYKSAAGWKQFKNIIADR